MIHQWIKPEVLERATIVKLFQDYELQVAKLDRQVTTTSVDQAPSRSKPEIFHSNRYIKMIDESNSLRFNFRWEDLRSFSKDLAATVIWISSCSQAYSRRLD
ncbi:hypothetical protein OS493_022749 [Desmophyllum pertusum]|uniref:Uncharacterized protein n=1 Tax=Desmophyllum pertusum TaxID=174260 RepID=A0A9X0CE41_9CNID|nr:hypothetical protein OS493_022749 [Desmophyllum pertusum]